MKYPNSNRLSDCRVMLETVRNAMANFVDVEDWGTAFDKIDLNTILCAREVLEDIAALDRKLLAMIGEEIPTTRMVISEESYDALVANTQIVPPFPPGPTHDVQWRWEGK